MRRLILIVSSMAVLLAISGCKPQSAKPKNMSDQMYKLGIAGLETIDEYLDSKINLDEASDRVSKTNKAASSQLDKSKEELGVDALLGTEYADDFTVYHTLTMLSNAVMNRSLGTGTNREILDYRNELAESLNERTRK